MNNFNKISEAIRYIDDHLSDPLSVQMIAEHFAFSPYYFHRLFTSVVGKSMIAYIRDRRIVYACRMLNETDRKVLEIALEYGFDSAQSFSRTFKSVTGMSPTAYRGRNIAPDIVPAAELVKRFTNRLRGGILMNPNMIKRNKMTLAGVSGDGSETAEVWRRFMKLAGEYPLADKVSDDGYEVRIFDSATGSERIFAGCEIKEGAAVKGDRGEYEILEMPSSEYASFDVYVADGYESENNAMSEWLLSNDRNYVRKLYEGKPYCIEHYDARFDGDSDESIVEIWLPVIRGGEDYRIDGIKILLNEDCIVQRFYPLIQYKNQLSENLSEKGFSTKNACAVLSDEELIKAGLPDKNMAALFRCFLHCYEYKGKGIKDIPDAAYRSEEEVSSLLELMRLPGVKAVRAQLYYHCGIRTLSDFAAADAGQLRDHIANAIVKEKLPFSPPQPKELRTQIAVAKVFTEYAC